MDSAMNKNELLLKTIFWVLWAIVVSVCAFFIVYNAHWVIGDDAIIMSHTGKGLPFLPSGTINPAAGRFYPFAYLPYDILLLFFGGYISPTAHYALQAVFFVVFALSAALMYVNILEGKSHVWKYVLAFLAFIAAVGRAYPQFTECFATSWVSYTLISLFLLFSYMFHKKQKWCFGIVSLLCVNFFCYIGEQCFVLPLVMGVCSLLFGRKWISRKEKVFDWLLIGSALLFLLIYLVWVFPYIETAYDSGHGSQENLIINGFKMFVAQKIIIIAFVFLVYRVVMLVRNKEQYGFFDTLLLTAFGCFCSGVVLKLNWTLYYNSAALICIPAILYFSSKHLKLPYAVGVMLVIGAFYGYKIPKTIRYNQNHRITVAQEVQKLTDAVSEGDVLYWYAPNCGNGVDYNLELRNWKESSLKTYLRWEMRDEAYDFVNMEVYDPGLSGIWLSASENETLTPDKMTGFKEEDKVFEADGIMGYKK